MHWEHSCNKAVSCYLWNFERGPLHPCHGNKNKSLLLNSASLFLCPESLPCSQAFTFLVTKLDLPLQLRKLELTMLCGTLGTFSIWTDTEMFTVLKRGSNLETNLNRRLEISVHGVDFCARMLVKEWTSAWGSWFCCVVKHEFTFPFKNSWQNPLSIACKCRESRRRYSLKGTWTLIVKPCLILSSLCGSYVNFLIT